MADPEINQLLGPPRILTAVLKCRMCAERVPRTSLTYRKLSIFSLSLEDTLSTGCKSMCLTVGGGGRKKTH